MKTLNLNKIKKIYFKTLKHNKFFLIVIVIIAFLSGIAGTACTSERHDGIQYDDKSSEKDSSVIDLEELQPERQINVYSEDVRDQGNFENITLTIIYDIDLTGNTSKIEFKSTLPSNYEKRQKIVDYRFSIEPSEIYSVYGNTYTRFIINSPPEHFSIRMDIEMEIHDFDLTVAMKNQENHVPEEISQDILKEYLKSEPNIEVSDSTIKDIASEFTADGQLDLIEEIYNYVIDSMAYHGYDPGNNGAAAAVMAGGGDCTEYSDLFVALCRANGIPARVIDGYVIDSGPEELSLGHNWSEVYVDDLGWIPFDTIYDDNNGDSKNTTFENLQNIYIYTGFSRNDIELYDFHYYAYLYYGDTIDVTKRVYIK